MALCYKHISIMNSGTTSCIVQKLGVHLLVGPAQNVYIARCMLEDSKNLPIAERLSMWTMLVRSCSEAVPSLIRSISFVVY